MINKFGLTSSDERNQEFTEYKDKEIGLDSKQGTHYGIIKSEDAIYVHMNPHLAYNSLPLPDGKVTYNIEKRNSTLKIPKRILSGLIHQYPRGYLEKLVDSTNEQDNFSRFMFQKENITPEPKKLSFKEKFKAARDIFRKE